MARTGMRARALAAARRMALGPNALVYILAYATGDVLESIGSTYSAHEIANGGAVELHICEDDTNDRDVLGRAAAFAIASETESSPIYYVWSVAGTSTPAVGQAMREWAFPIRRTNQTFTPVTSDNALLLEIGDFLLLETGDHLLMEA